MSFNIEQFYKELDQHYSAHDNAATEEFLKKSKETAYEAGLVIPYNEGCPSCMPEITPNWEYVSVCNEMACFYRGLSRFEESLETFSMAQKELENLYKQTTPEYATILLNKAGTYRYMGELDKSLEHFTKAAEILEKAEKKNFSTLAGLYNNIGLVYLDKRELQQAVDYFTKALALIDGNQDMIVEQGTTWNNLAAGYHGLGDMEKAEEAIKKAVDILGELDCGVNPHYPAALNTRGTFAFYRGDYKQAYEDFKEGLEKTKLVYGENVEYAGGCQNCAAACSKLGLDQEAEEWMEAARRVQEKLV